MHDALTVGTEGLQVFPMCHLFEHRRDIFDITVIVGYQANQLSVAAVRAESGCGDDFFEIDVRGDATGVPAMPNRRTSFSGNRRNRFRRGCLRIGLLLSGGFGYLKQRLES